MTDTLLSPSDLKFLQSLHSIYGIGYVRWDQSGLDTGKNENFKKKLSEQGLTQLEQISKRLHYRLDSNFQINFSSQFTFDIIRL